MGGFIKYRLLIFMLTVGAALTVPTSTAQKSSPFYWEFVNVDIEVLENGDMLVTETQKYVFTALDALDAEGETQISLQAGDSG